MTMATCGRRSARFSSTSITSTTATRPPTPSLPGSKTRHQGIEASVNYALEGVSPILSRFDVYATYAYVDATIREEGPNKGNRVPFSSKNKGAGHRLYAGPWKANLDSSYQTDQFADNANTRAESADGSTGKIPGYMVFSSRVGYDFGPQLADLNVAVGVKNILNHEYFTRSFDDSKGKYARRTAHRVPTDICHFDSNR